MVHIFEFTVFMGGEKVAEEVVFTKVEGSNVTLKEVLGEQWVIKNACIIEVNVVGQRLILSGEPSSTRINQST
jgi:predicted RNA-binding protein